MTASLQTTQYPLARHYLDRLRSAYEAVRHGYASSAYGLTILDHEWKQIPHWQSSTASRGSGDKVSAHLRKVFPLARLEILPNRNSAPDQKYILSGSIRATDERSISVGSSNGSVCLRVHFVSRSVP
jgi:hypothetical protein